MLHYVPIKCTYAVNAVCMHSMYYKRNPKMCKHSFMSTSIRLLLGDFHGYHSLQVILLYFCLSLIDMWFEVIANVSETFGVWIVVCVLNGQNYIY